LSSNTMDRHEILVLLEKSVAQSDSEGFTLKLNKRDFRKIRNYIRKSRPLLAYLLEEYVWDEEIGWPEDCRVEDACEMTGKMEENG
jgi:hypothetical protein